MDRSSFFARCFPGPSDRYEPPPPLQQAEEDDDDEQSTTSFTPSVQRNTYLAEDESYWRPVDDLHSDVERAWDQWRTTTFDLYPDSAAATVEALLNEPGSSILDVGAGRQALWLIAMATRYPKAEAIAVDLLPVVDRFVPPNCSFEIYDVQGGLPYPEDHFSLVSHSWLLCYLHPQQMSYPTFVDEITRVLRPGGLYLLVEPCNIWVPEDGTPLVVRFPAMARFLDVYRAVCMSRGSGWIDLSNLREFGKVIRESGAFSRVVERVQTTRLGPQDPADGGRNRAGSETLLMIKAGFRSWVPLALGWTREASIQLERDVQRELESLVSCKKGEGIEGKVCVLFAVLNEPS
ncbi:S-adenosyl-L-methionine-dependent methyltransferase [Mrakia frigida]|uniref:class I SAM-dependent methyltransferase n=1 Tax=Mrakia frigida TaxID=29902 RepID=UPI003FCBF48E